MVLLSMTPALADTVSLYLSKNAHRNESDDPALDSPRSGNPISHKQIILISRFFQSQRRSSNEDIDGSVNGDATAQRNLPTRLNDMLRGCTLYQPPPVAKSEPSSEYLALMARLRAEQEERNYASMLPSSTPSNPFSFISGDSTSLNKIKSKEDLEEEIVHESSSRQVTLIFNILVSIICTFFAIFFAARSWSPPPRVALSLFGALGVGIAEVGVYWGYLRRLEEARRIEMRKVEVKELVNGESWIIEAKPKTDGVKKRKIKKDDNEKI